MPDEMVPAADAERATERSRVGRGSEVLRRQDPSNTDRWPHQSPVPIEVHKDQRNVPQNAAVHHRELDSAVQVALKTIAADREGKLVRRRSHLVPSGKKRATVRVANVGPRPGQPTCCSVVLERSRGNDATPATDYRCLILASDD